MAPAQSCGSARTALEFIVTLIYQAASGGSYITPSLFEMMNDSAFVNRINDEGLLTAMHTVQKNGNRGAHGDSVSVQTACETLKQLQFVVGEFCLNLGIINDYPVFASPIEASNGKKGERPECPDPAAPAPVAPAVPVKAAELTPAAQPAAQPKECAPQQRDRCRVCRDAPPD